MFKQTAISHDLGRFSFFCSSVFISDNSRIDHGVQDGDTLAVKKVAANARLVDSGGRPRVAATAASVIAGVVEFFKVRVKDTLDLQYWFIEPH